MKIIVIFFLILFPLSAFSSGFNAPFNGSKFSGLTRNATIFETDSTINQATGALIDISGENIQVNSEDGSAWTPTRSSVSTNTYKNPVNGELTADTLVEDGTAANTHYLSSGAVTITIGQNYTYSLYVKPINRTWIRLYRAGATPNVDFGLTGSGVVGTQTSGVGGTILDAKIQKVTNGWYRISMTFNTLSATGFMVFAIGEADNDVFFDGLNQASLAFWGAQIVKNDDFLQGPGIYHPTTATTKPRHDLTPSASSPTKELTDIQGVDGNYLTGMKYTAASTQYFSKAHHDSFNIFDSNHTITAVVKLNDGAAGTEHVVFSHGQSGGSGCGMRLRYASSNNEIDTVYYNNVTSEIVNGEAMTVNDGMYRVIQAIRIDNNAKICVDGICGEYASVSGLGTDCSLTQYLGCSNTPSLYFDGDIAYLRIDAEGTLQNQLNYEREYIKGILSQTTLETYDNTLPQMITDGNMEAVGTASWTSINNATLSKQAGYVYSGHGSQVLRVARSTTNNPTARQAVMLSGYQYRVIGYARSDGTCIPSVYTTADNVFWTGTNSTSWQQFDVISSAINPNIGLISTNVTIAGQYCEFDDFYVYQYGPAFNFTRASLATRESSNKRLSKTPDYGQPRIGGDGGGLEVESQVQNKCLQSANFNTTWTKNALTSVSTDVVEDPFGTTTADGLIGTAVDTQHGVRQLISVTAARWTFSMYAKPGNYDWVYLADSTVANAYAYFNVRTCTVGTVGAGAAYAKAIPSHCPTTGLCWCRISVSYTGTAASHTHQMYTADGDGDNSVLGDAATINTYLFGAQVEQFPVPSSYIATTTSAQTRSAEVVTIDPHPANSMNIILPETICPTCAAKTMKISIDSLCRSNVFAEMVTPAVFMPILEISGNTGTASITRNRLLIYVGTTGRIETVFRDDASADHNIITAVDGVPYGSWFTITFYFDTTDLSRMYTTVSGYSGAYTYALNSGTGTFDTTNTQIRVGNIYNGNVYSSCRYRNLQILLNQ